MRMYKNLVVLMSLLSAGYLFIEGSDGDALQYRYRSGAAEYVASVNGSGRLAQYLELIRRDELARSSHRPLFGLVSTYMNIEEDGQSRYGAMNRRSCVQLVQVGPVNQLRNSSREQYVPVAYNAVPVAVSAHFVNVVDTDPEVALPVATTRVASCVEHPPVAVVTTPRSTERTPEEIAVVIKSRLGCCCKLTFYGLAFTALGLLITVMVRACDYTITNQTGKVITVIGKEAGSTYTATISSGNSTHIRTSFSLDSLCVQSVDEGTACATRQALSNEHELYAREQDAGLTLSRNAQSIQLPSLNGTESEYMYDIVRPGYLRGTGEKH